MLPSVAALRSSEPTFSTQFALGAISGIVWYLLIKLGGDYVVQPWVRKQPWRDQWTTQNRKTFKKSYLIDFKTQEQAFAMACSAIMTCMQHIVGGILCIPAVIGMTGTTVSSLACHCGICEVGWELQDITSRLCQIVFGGQDGRAKNPLAVMILMGIHHTMGLGLVIPMNVYYHDNPYYHELLFNLQFAAGVALGMQSWGYTLNVKTPDGLLKMKASVIFVWLTMMWSRVVRYCPISYSLLRTFWANGHHAMLYGGVVVIVCMGLINVLMVADATKKLLKFLRMRPSAPAEKVDNDAKEPLLKKGAKAA